MTEFFPSSFATIQPGPGTLVLGSNNGAPYNVDTSQIATFSYVDTAISLAASAASGAALDSPHFTGMPTAPTATPGSDDFQIANTAFVYNAIASASVGSSSASGSVTVVTSFDGRYGQVTLEESDVTMALGFMPAASGGNANYEFAVAPASGGMYATPLGQVESLIQEASTAYAASGGNANYEFAVAPATGSMYATPLEQVETLIQAASGMYANINGSIEEEFAVAPAGSNFQAPQTLQVQNNAFNFSTMTTSASGASGLMITSAYYPPLLEYADGMVVAFTVPVSNTGPVQFNAGAGMYPVIGNGGIGALLQGNELRAGRTVAVMWNTVGYWELAFGYSANNTYPAEYSYQAPQWGQVYAGNNAEWYNVTATRALNTTYTNSTGKPISVSILVDNDTADGTINAYSNNNIVAYSCGTVANYYMAINYTVPTGATYMIAAGTGTLNFWWELY
jgi:hypothetical protein